MEGGETTYETADTFTYEVSLRRIIKLRLLAWEALNTKDSAEGGEITTQN
jgi:hypothetical protein